VTALTATASGKPPISLPPNSVYAVDASPLIVLAKIGRLDLLTVGGRQVQVTETVYREVLAGEANDPARLALIGGFGARTPDVPIEVAFLTWPGRATLDAGEEATLALALSTGATAVLDDGDARRVAKALGILYIGTVGLVLAGKRRGVVASAADVLRALRAVHSYLPSDARLREELELLGETWP
jgi:predicted nucleic acid-binding protein